MSSYNQITPEIFTVGEFLTTDQCDVYIELAESIGFTDAPINTLRGPQLCPDVRNNTRVMLDDVRRTAELWQRASGFVPHTVDNWQAVGVNERLRFSRYDVGQQFNWHFDGDFQRDNGERRKLTFMIYLNADFEGGRTMFPETIKVPKTGLALFFVHQQLHRGETVVRGRKYVLRTDVMYRREDR